MERQDRLKRGLGIRGQILKFCHSHSRHLILGLRLHRLILGLRLHLRRQICRVQARAGREHFLLRGIICWGLSFRAGSIRLCSVPELRLKLRMILKRSSYRRLNV